MAGPVRKPGENEYRISYDKPNGIATVILFAKNENDIKKLFKTYVGKYDIRNVRKLS